MRVKRRNIRSKSKPATASSKGAGGRGWDLLAGSDWYNRFCDFRMRITRRFTPAVYELFFVKIGSWQAVILLLGIEFRFPWNQKF